MQDKIIIGRFGSTHGVKGWISIHSFTEPRDNILQLFPWYIKKNAHATWQELEISETRIQGKKIVAKLPGINCIELAKTYTNIDIAIDKEQLPELEEGEYYWRDLEGLLVINKEGVELGHVDHIFDTGSNDVIVVKNEKEHLIPYIKDYVLEVDMDKQVIKVDWDPEF